MKNTIKYYLTLIVMNVLKVFWIFPVKNDEVLFLSYNGKQYSDSPLCLSKYIKNRFPDKKIVWSLFYSSKDNTTEIDKVVNPKSISFIYHLCTAGTIISNNSISSFLPIRKKQIFLNTWHGGSPTKTVGFRESNPNPYYKYHFRIQAMKTTAIISSSEFFTKEVIGESFGFERTEVLETGLPRNDILINEHKSIVEKVYKHFGIEHNAKNGIVLYAPTFRGDANNSSFLKPEEMFLVAECLEWLNRKFDKEFVFLFRGHHVMNSDSLPGSISATEYPEMQELLCAADVLITDYSSCMHDFSLMRKPALLYVPDYKEYIKDRGFYWDIPTMPFPYAESIDAFKDLIESFDYKQYDKNIDDYFERLGNFEDGNATERVVSWLEQKWRKVGGDI